MSWTDPKDIKDRWIDDDVIPVSDTQLQTFIDDFEMLVLRAFPNIQARIDNTSLNVRLLNKVTADAIIDTIKTQYNIYTNVSESVGPFNKSVTYNNNIRRNLKLSQDDINTLSALDTVGAVFQVSRANVAYNETLLGRIPGEGTWHGIIIA